MRQKFMISRDDTLGQLKIREYAVTERDPKKVLVSMLEKSKFTFLCEEIYTSEVVRLAIDSGLPALVTNLRTRNLFPVAPFVNVIAEAVVKLYEAPGTGDVELFFDDADLVSILDAKA